MAMTTEQVKKLVQKTSKKIAENYGLDENKLSQIATAIIWKESRNDPNAKNKGSTARGLMQVLINTQRETEKKYAKVPFAVAQYKSSYYPEAPVGKTDKMYDPEYNVLIGMNYLAYQLKRYGDTTKGIHAYNQGSYPARKFDGMKYADSVNKYISENLPISEFKSTNPIKKIVELVKPKKENNNDATVKVEKTGFYKTVSGAFY